MSIKICLLWHSFSSANLGVGALSICNYKIIEDEVSKIGIDAEYIVIGNVGSFNYTPCNTNNNIRFIHFSAKSFAKRPFSILKEISACDVVFDIGEGDSFSDIYGYPRLLKMLLGKYAATMAGVPLVMSPQTIGPFTGKLARNLARKIMLKSVLVVARDHMSRKVLEELQVTNSSEAIDVAFCLDFERDEKKIKNNCSTLMVGINVSGLLYNGGYSRGNQFGLSVDYKVMIDEIVETFSGMDGVELHLIPHVISQFNTTSVEDDYRVSIALKEKFPDSILPERFSSPVEAKSYISNMDFFIGARMHATIAAISSGVPVVPLAYSRKFSGLYETIGYPHVIDMKKVTKTEAIEKIMTMFGSLDEVKCDVEGALSRVNSKLDTYKSDVNKVLMGYVNDQK